MLIYCSGTTTNECSGAGVFFSCGVIVGLAYPLSKTKLIRDLNTRVTLIFNVGMVGFERMSMPIGPGSILPPNARYKQYVK